MELDVLLLARMQFALTIMFHYIFPPLSIGLGWLMVVTEGLYLKTGDKHYEQITRFWTKIFAVNFALGVASGIVMEFQFGTNWAAYSRFVGDVFGSALAAEGIFAFFLESGFLAVLVFGWDRVSSRVHFFSTVMVAIGATFSAVWIVVANSWMHTPAGFHIVGEGLAARAEITSFWEMVFNPSSMHRLNHVLIGCLIQAAFFAMSISAWYILKGKHQEAARRMFVLGLLVGGVFSLLAGISGHHQAQKVAETQPAKLAAFEGLFETPEEGAPLYLWGFPDEENQRLRMAIGVPGLLSFLVHGNFHETVPGLDQFPEEDRPPVAIPFYTYHIMIAIGMFNILLTGFAALRWWQGALFQTRWLLWVFVFSVIGPYVANQTGWIAAEVGRQPWLVYGLLRTSDGLSEVVAAEQVLGSIIMFAVIYTLLFAVWIYVLNEKIQHGPEPVGAAEPGEPTGTGFLDTAADWVAHTPGYSLTGEHEPEDETGNEKE